jgi:hypothetical protein
MWGESTTRIFSVSSTYEMLMNHESSQQTGESSNAKMLNETWRKLGKLRILGKVRHFLWRACSEALSTKHNLHESRVIDDPTCVFCCQKAETTTHIL